MKVPFAIISALVCFSIAFHSNTIYKNIRTNRQLQSTTNNTPADDGQFLVGWTLSLGGKEFLLDSPFLKAGLEQSIKDYINLDILCGDGINVDSSTSVSFHSVEINNADTSDEIGKRRLRRIEGNGKCKGDPERCIRTLTGTADGIVNETVDDEDDFFEIESKRNHIFPKNNKNNDLCEEFQRTSIFDLFQKVLVTASSFNYNVDVDVIADLQGSLDLTYNVTFQPATGDGLDQIDSVGMGVKDIVPINTQCSESQCITQRSVIRNIFDHFEMTFDENKHECLHQGLNCDPNDLVTHIWIDTDDSRNYTIPELFAFLPSLKGLFLGGNKLVGTIPSSLGSIRKLEMLWTQDNALTGPIPTQLGNIRGLLQLNLHGNKLTGSIPTELRKLENLQLLNLGHNELVGTIPDLSTKETAGLNIPPVGCSSFPNPFVKLGQIWSKSLTSSNIVPFINLKTLSLYGNNLSGSMSSGFSRLMDLVDLTLGQNNFIGELPTELGDLKTLSILDVHDNLLSGMIPSEIGKIHQLKSLNIYNNRFEKTIPTNIGKLTQLTEIILDNNALSGPIPSQIGSLLNLEYLSFSGNRMSGEIPSELGNLESLKNLDIRDYSVIAFEGSKRAAGTIPTELGKLKDLTYVIFQNNSIIGTIPTELGNLQSARIIWLKNEQFTGDIPSELGQVESLSILSLGNNFLVGTIPTELGALSKLSTFDVGSNGFEGSIPTEIANSSRLKYMGLDNLNLTGAIPSEFGNLSILEYLSVEDNTLTGTIPTELGQLEALKALNVGKNTLTGTIPIELANVSEMLYLSLESNALDGEIPSVLGNLGQLISLELGSNNLTGMIPSEFGMIESLRSLDLGGNELTGEVPSQFGLLISLEELALEDNDLIGSIPTELGSTGLKLIELSNNKLTGPIPTELGLLTTLEDIIVADCGLSGSIPSELGGIETLFNLNLGGNLFTGSIPIEVQNGESLARLNISGNNITGDLWFICDLMSYEIDEGTVANCSNYCETVDEECNSDSIGNATCADVGCSGSSIPSCTELCRLDYSTCSAGADEMLFQLDLRTDNNAWQTSWLISDNTDTVVWQMDEGSYRNVDSIVEFRCMQRACYTFEIFDSGGDGICCGQNEPDDVGHYSVLVDSVTVSWTKASFESSASHDIGTCSGAPFPSTVSMKPSKSPSWWPSSMPSMSPSGIPSYHPSSLPSESSLHPTDLPSEHPSFVPSAVPSSAPTLYPSATPSLHPTDLPSEHPSSVPSVVPSSAPSLLPSDPPTLFFIQLLPPAGRADDYFGRGISVSGSIVAVGAYKSDEHSTDFGSAYIFDTTGQYVTTLASPDAAENDFFGYAIATSGSVVVVCAYSNDALGRFTHTGAAYIYETTGQYVKKLLPPTISPGDNFGFSVDISGSIIVVGARKSDERGTDSGAAYIFDTTGQYVTNLVALSTTAGDFFGCSVGVSGSIIVVGAQTADSNGVDSGAAYIFDTTGHYVTDLEAPDTAAGDNFGVAVAASRSIIVVGAIGADSDGVNSGSAYVFDTIGQYVMNLVAPDNAARDHFGISLDVSESIIVVGASDDDDNGANSGSVYVFDTTGQFMRKLVAPNGAAGDNFGRAIGVSESTIVVGAYLDDDNGFDSGSAYLFP